MTTHHYTRLNNKMMVCSNLKFKFLGSI